MHGCTCHTEQADAAGQDPACPVHGTIDVTVHLDLTKAVGEMARLYAKHRGAVLMFQQPGVVQGITREMLELLQAALPPILEQIASGQSMTAPADAVRIASMDVPGPGYLPIAEPPN